MYLIPLIPMNRYNVDGIQVNDKKYRFLHILNIEKTIPWFVDKHHKNNWEIGLHYGKLDYLIIIIYTNI